MHGKVQRFRMTGKIGDTEFTDENILAGSFSITNQCCGNNEIQIGQVYIGELNATFLGLNLKRYSLKGMKIQPVFGLMLADGSYEDVPLGVFNISEASWTASGLVVKAYDNMSLLDKSCNSSQTNGTAFDIAKMACEACKLTLGTMDAEFKTFANGAETISLYEENDVETWRDLLSWVGQTVACNVMAGRDGSIIFRPYNKTIVDTLDEEHRFAGGSFSDFETRYTGLSCVNLADKTTKYYGVEEDTGLTYNLGTNPFMQYGVDETKDALRNNVLTALQQIDYVPFKCSLIGNPAYDLMDVFSFSGGIADADKLFCMTKFDFKYNGSYVMEGVGKNPALASARSKSDKNIAGLLNQVVTNEEHGKLGIKTFTNATAFSVTDKDIRIISLQFASAQENHMQFFGQVVIDVKADPVDRRTDAKGTVVVPIPALKVVSGGDSTGSTEASSDTATDADSATSGSEMATDGSATSGSGSSEEGTGTATEPMASQSTEAKEVSVDVSLPVSWQEDGRAVCYVTFELNDEEITLHHPVETWHSGKHTLHLYYPIEHVTPNYTNTFNVYLRMTGGSGDVEVGACLASVSGQAMGAQEAWDGKLEIEDSIVIPKIGMGVSAVGYTETVSKELHELVQRSYSDVVHGRAKIGGYPPQIDMT
jgi:hypothetical protein